jgi:pyruvate/2-oxoglutarate/acetoin dehydrogenase E1 component
LQLQECFNNLNDLSIKLAGARNTLIKTETEVKELEKAAIDSKEALTFIKKNDVIDMKVYEYSQNRNNAFENSLKDAKIQRLLQEAAVRKYGEERQQLLEKYNELEAKMKLLGNNVIEMVKYGQQ